MSNDLEDWSDLQAAWRRDHLGQDAPSLERLREQVRRERARAWAEAIAEAAVSLFCIAVFVWWGAGAAGGARMLFAALAVATAGLLVVTFVLRRALWRAHGATVAEYRGVLLRRARLGLTFARLSYVGAPLGVGLGLIVAQLADSRAPVDLPGLNTAIAVIAGAVLVVGWIWSLREARRHRRTIEAFAAEAD
jgi:Flp pilus assembly protein TadB